MSGRIQLSIDFDELLLNELGQFRLQYFSNGRLVTLGNLTDTDINNAVVDQYPASQEAPSSQIPADSNMFSSPWMRLMTARVGTDPLEVTPTSPPLASADDESMDPYYSFGESNFDPEITMAEDHSPTYIAKADRSMVHVDPMTDTGLQSIVEHIGVSYTACLKTSLGILDYEIKHLFGGDDLKKIVPAILLSVRPERRRSYPYRKRVSPPWWPPIVSYRDPAHMLVSERYLLMLWLLLEPSHSLRLIKAAPGRTGDRRKMLTILPRVIELRRLLGISSRS